MRLRLDSHNQIQKYHEESERKRRTRDVSVSVTGSIKHVVTNAATDAAAALGPRRAQNTVDWFCQLVPLLHVLPDRACHRDWRRKKKKGEKKVSDIRQKLTYVKKKMLAV